jgi:hypothetical protein
VIRKINEFYEKAALDYEGYIRTALYKSAIIDYENSIKNSYPVHQYEAMLVYTITYNQNCAISLYFDKYEYTGGAHGNTVRLSQMWSLNTGRQISLRSLFPDNPHYISDLKNEIISQIEVQIRMGNNIYFDNYKDLVNKTFNSDSFYLTPDALVIYFGQYDIAPYSSGIPEFHIPYKKVNAALPYCKR